MSKKEKLDETLKKKLAEIINQELPQSNFLITVSEIDCATNLSQIKTRVSVLPENLRGTALKKLKSKSRQIAEELKRKANLSRVPKIIWQIDSSSQNIFKIDEALNQ